MDQDQKLSNEEQNSSSERSGSKATFGLNAAPAKSKRDPVAVIDQMLALIPQTDPLRERLLHVRKNASYRAPEQQWDTWYEGSELLSTTLPPPHLIDGWQKEIAAIWINEPVASEQKGD